MHLVSPADSTATTTTPGTIVVPGERAASVRAAGSTTAPIATAISHDGWRPGRRPGGRGRTRSGRGPGAARRVDRRAVGAPRARRRAGLVGRQVERPERAQRIDAPGRGDVSVASPPPTGRRARGTRRSRRRAASTAGIIASSEPPVVRMSSTSRTRSPGSMRKPRRNSRRRAPSASRTSSAKMPRVPSWRAVSNARMTPPVVGPATRSTGARPPSASRSRAAPAAAQLARRRRVLEHLELLEVAVAVAAALEQEVALAQGARSRRNSASVRARRCAGRGVERRSERGHAAVSRSPALESPASGPVLDALRRGRGRPRSAAPSR